MSFSAARCCAVSRQLSISSETLTPRISSFQPVGIHLRKLQQVVRQPRQAAGMLQNDPEKALAILRIVDRAGQQRFRKSLNGRQRRLEFVRHVGHEIAPHPLQFPQFRDVVQHHHRARTYRPRAPPRPSPRKSAAAAFRSRSRLRRAVRRRAPAAPLRSTPSAARLQPARCLISAEHRVPEFRRSSGWRTPAAPRRSPPRRLPPCCPESRTTGCALRSAFGWCDPSALRSDSATCPAPPARRRSHRRATVGSPLRRRGAKILFRRSTRSENAS